MCCVVDILLNSDIVLNGAPCFHDGNSDWRHWAPIDWASIDEPAQLWYGAAYPPQSVRIEGNTHAPNRNGSAVLLIAGEGVILNANEMGTRTPDPATTNIALVETGSDASLFDARRVSLKANTGWSAVNERGDLTNGGLVRLLPTEKQYNMGVGLHTWVLEDPPDLYRPQNLLAGAHWCVVPRISPCLLKHFPH